VIREATNGLIRADLAPGDQWLLSLCGGVRSRRESEEGIDDCGDLAGFVIEVHVFLWLFKSFVIIIAFFYILIRVSVLFV